MNELEKELDSFLDILKKEKDNIKQRSGIPKKYFSFKWTDYIPEHIGDGIKLDEEIIESRKKAKKRCAFYSKNLGNINSNGGRSLLLIGGTGSGKSVLGTLILRDVISKLRESVFYIDFSQFAIEAQMVHLDEQRMQFENKYLSPQWLMIDEIDEDHCDGKFADKVRELFSLILWRRFHEGKSTIITTSIRREGKLQQVVGKRAFKIFENSEAFFPKIQIATIQSEYREDEDFFDRDKVYNSREIVSALTNYMAKSQKILSDYKRNPKNRKPKFENIEYIDSESLKNILSKAGI